MEKQIQQRGHCQLCGNQQAVRGGMAKHGYTVDHGWFNGVCNGAHRQPMEVERSLTDAAIAQIAEDVIALEALALKIEGGWLPEEVLVDVETGRDNYGRRIYGKQLVPFASLKPWDQISWPRSEVYRLRGRAKAGTDFAAYLAKVADAVHGQLLVEVVKPAAAARIEAGEKRIGGSAAAPRVITARYQDGARVYWQDDKGKGWVGTQAWRKLPLA